MIEGGFILQPRKIDYSDIMHEPPVVRELWLYLIRNVNHKDNCTLKRGQGIFTLQDIGNDLHWMVGYRKMKYSKTQLTKSLRKLRERFMIETTKTTKGIIVTITKYDFYQNPENYEGNSEGTPKKTRKKKEDFTINKNDKNGKNERNISSPNGDMSVKIDFDKLMEFWNEKVELAKITVISDRRKKAINARVKEFGKQSIQEVIEKTSKSGFLNGKNKENWTADFDWVFSPTNFIRIKEGKFDDKNGFNKDQLLKKLMMP